MCESEFSTLNELFERYHPLGVRPLPSPKRSFADAIIIGHQLAVMGDDTAPDLKQGLEFAHARALENLHPHFTNDRN